MEFHQGRAPALLLWPPHMSGEGQARYLYTMHKSLGLSAPKSLYLDKSLSTSFKYSNVFARARLDRPQIFAPAHRLGLLQPRSPLRAMQCQGDVKELLWRNFPTSAPNQGEKRFIRHSPAMLWLSKVVPRGDKI